MSPASTRRTSRRRLALGDDLGIDSLTLVEVVVAAEDRFGLVITDDDWSRFVTVGDVIAYIERAGIIAPA